MPAGLFEFVQSIERIKAQLSKSLDQLGPDDHLPRVMLVGQLQIIEAVLANAELYTSSSDQ